MLTGIVGEQSDLHPDQGDTGRKDQCQLVLRIS